MVDFISFCLNGIRSIVFMEVLEQEGEREC